MDGILLHEAVLGERVGIALDESDILIAGKAPRIALLKTDAAIAFGGTFDLGGIDLEDKRTAVAVATVGFHVLLCGSHDALGSVFNWKQMNRFSDRWSNNGSLVGFIF